MRKATGLLMVLASLLFFATAMATPASADPNGPGNNGTVKIVNNNDDPITADDRDNDPHVCQFHIYGFHFDNNSSGTWIIDRWAPTGSGLAASGTWKADGAGQFHVVGPALADGHYKLFVKQTAPSTPGGDKQKVFWVECGTTSTSGGETATPTPTPATNSGTTTTNNSSSSNSSTSENNENNNTSSSNNSSNSSSNSSTVENNNTSSNTSNTNTSGIVIFTPPPTQLGFQSGPMGAVTPQVETPTGASQNNENVAGQQTNNANTGIVAGVESLPSTSTAPQLPLLGLGFALAAAGGLMLRRRTTIN